MAQLLDEIRWGEPILAPVADAAWEAEIKRRGGRVSEVDRRVMPSPWLREASLGVTTYRPGEMPPHLFNIGLLVTSQENSCRYCYGARRAYMKILGYSESFINRIERDVHMAELDDGERAFIAFCRNLARSRPRPAKADCGALIKAGFTQAVVDEMALVIAMGCFYNRIGILIACPPEQEFERMANGWLGRLIGVAGPVTRALAARKRRARPAAAVDSRLLANAPFGPILARLAGLEGAVIMRSALEGAFVSNVLPRSTKALMFAVVARTLGCGHCESEACGLLSAEGLDGPEIEAALATLHSKRLRPHEGGLLSWVRDTVHYQTAAIQGRTRALAKQIGNAAALEAIGVAALANATVRLGMLLE